MISSTLINFVNDIVHELRTPLAALKTHAQIALKAESQQDRESALQKIIQCVDLSAHVITQLLTLNRLNQEEPLQNIGQIDLKQLTTEIVAYLTPTALEKNINIQLLSTNRPIIQGNNIAIGILIRNLVENAIRYTPPQGAVKIQLKNSKNHIILRVTDTGPGIPEELRQRVFERFFRVPDTADAGSGLGLAIVRHIVELHDAEITLTTPENEKGLQCDVIFKK